MGRGRTYIVGVEGEVWVCEGREDVHCGSGGGGVGLWGEGGRTLWEWRGRRGSVRGGRTYIVGVEGEAWVCEGREDVHCGSGGGGVGLWGEGGRTLWELRGRRGSVRGGRTYIVGVEGEVWVCEGREDVHCGSGGGGVGLWGEGDVHCGSGGGGVGL